MNKLNCLIINSILIIFSFLNCEKKNPSNPSEYNKWIEINHGLTNLQIRDIAIHSLNPQAIYVATAQGIFKSEDGGKNWLPQNDGLSCRDITDIEIISQGNGIVLACSWGGGIFRSENNGDDWTAINNGLADPRVFVVAASYESTPTYYAGTESGLFKSENYGERWEKVAVPVGNWPTTCISISSRDSATIYLGIKWNGVYKSTNGGLIWEQKNKGLAGNQQSGYVSPTAIKIDPVDDNRIFLGASWLGMYVSIDAAATWSLRESWPEGTELKCLVLNPMNSDEIYAGTNSGVFYSANTGISWNQMNDGLADLGVRALAIDPKDARIIYAGTMGGGVFKFVRE